ncbi:hypothetical protein RJ641_019046 [Dillenia turbinata]|uniref:Uncharacterized protein n=1 Tax=Dillenia turbinata TaxID=194707 RepID=A0AAN8YXT6_9MAGN
MEDQPNREVEQTEKVKDGSICGFVSLHRLLQASLSPNSSNRLLTRLNCGRALETISLPDSAQALSSKHDFDLQAIYVQADKEPLRQP